VRSEESEEEEKVIGCSTLVEKGDGALSPVTLSRIRLRRRRFMAGERQLTCKNGFRRGGHARGVRSVESGSEEEQKAIGCFYAS